MLLGSGYQRVGNDEATPSAEMCVTASQHGQETGVGIDDKSMAEPITVKVLLKEKSFEIPGIAESTTVGELKSRISSQTGVLPDLQRLIFGGKQLRPDTKLVSEFKITPGASIHLFPLPSVPQASVATTDAVTYNPISRQSETVDDEVQHRPIHFDPAISEHSKEVRLWCFILIFLSALTLFNNITFFMSSGSLGNGILDSTVTVLDTVCSALGLLVGNMGLKSIRTLDSEDLARYVRWLVICGLMSITLRILWVADVIQQVKLAVRESEEEERLEESQKNPGKGTSINDPTADNDEEEEPVLNKDSVISFGVQAGLIGLLCILAWLTCIIRARRLQVAASRYNLETNAIRTAAPPSAPPIGPAQV